MPRKLAPLSPVLMERSRRSGKSSATAARAAEDCATAAATTASGAGRATGGGWLPAPRGKPPAAKKQPTPGGVGGGRSDTLPRAAQGAAQAAGDVASPPRAHREAQASMPAVLTTMLLSKPAQLYIWSMWALLREANAEHTKSPARRACEASTLQRSVWLCAVATAGKCAHRDDAQAVLRAGGARQPVPVLERVRGESGGAPRQDVHSAGCHVSLRRVYLREHVRIRISASQSCPVFVCRGTVRYAERCVRKLLSHGAASKRPVLRSLRSARQFRLRARPYIASARPRARAGREISRIKKMVPCPGHQRRHTRTHTRTSRSHPRTLAGSHTHIHRTFGSPRNRTSYEPQRARPRANPLPSSLQSMKQRTCPGIVLARRPAPDHQARAARSKRRRSSIQHSELHHQQLSRLCCMLASTRLKVRARSLKSSSKRLDMSEDLRSASITKPAPV